MFGLTNWKHSVTVKEPFPFSLSLFYLARQAKNETQIYLELKQLNATNPSNLIQAYLMDYEESSGRRGEWRVEHHPILIYR